MVLGVKLVVVGVWLFVSNVMMLVLVMLKELKLGLMKGLIWVFVGVLKLVFG